MIAYGAVAEGPADWAWCCSQAARDVASGVADQAIVCCWTGTGASIVEGDAGRKGKDIFSPDSPVT
ncbi:RpiB/LacA/LacB family sugar-phosphate isomerase, partial [Streptosporangium algeriense]